MPNKIPTFGSRIQVYRGHAKKTSGGLTKSDLMMNKHGRVVSKAKHFTAKKEMRLLKHGYGTKKGKFGYVKIGTKSRKSRSRSRSRKMRGGMPALSPLDLGENTMAPNTSVPKEGMTGGRRRSMGMAMAGGSGMAPLSPQGDANWSGDSSLVGGNAMSRAQSRSLRRAKSRGIIMKSRGRAVGMHGGTISLHSQLAPAEL